MAVSLLAAAVPVVLTVATMVLLRLAAARATTRVRADQAAATVGPMPPAASTANQLLADGFDRVRETVHAAVEGLDEATLAQRPDPAANSIAWLVWHLARVQDDHIADVAGGEQLWTVGGWVERFGLPFEVGATGYGQSTQDVEQVRAGAELLTAYHDAVHRATVDYVRTLADDDYDRVVDERWDPPVTLGARLVSVLNDTTQHAGQASYVRGLLERGTGR